MGMCDKIYNAFSINRKQSRHRISHRIRTEPHSQPPNSRTAAKEVPIDDFAAPVLHNLPHENEKSVMTHASNHKNKTKPNVSVQGEKHKTSAETASLGEAVGLQQQHAASTDGKHRVKKEGGNKSEQEHINDDKFSDYIHRIKKKMRAASNLGRGKSFSGTEKLPDNSNDKFSDYINRGKLKFRAMTNVGVGKSVSFK